MLSDEITQKVAKNDIFLRFSAKTQQNNQSTYRDYMFFVRGQ